MAEGGDVRALLSKFNRQADIPDASARRDSRPVQPLSPGPRTWAPPPGTAPPAAMPANGNLRHKLSPMAPPQLPGAAAFQPQREPAWKPTSVPRGQQPGTPRPQLPPLGAGSSRPPARPTFSPRAGTAAAASPLLDPGRVRKTEELLQNMLLNRGAPPSPAHPPGPPAGGRGSVPEVTPLRKPLPAEGRQPVKPRRPQQVNLEPYLRRPRTSLPPPPLPGLKKNGGSPTMGGRSLPTSGPPLPPGLHRLPHKPLPQEPSATKINRQETQDTYDDIDTLGRDDSWDEGSSQNINGESDDSEVYESIDENELELPRAPPPVAKLPQTPKKQQLEMDKKELKEQQKRENEMRKKFQLKGPLEVLHIARVRRDWQGGKLDLAVRQGDTVEILRAKDNPGGKWLVRAETGKWGYVSIDCMDVDYETVKRQVLKGLQAIDLPPPPPDPPKAFGGGSGMVSPAHTDTVDDYDDDDDDYDDVEIPDDFPPPPLECSFDPIVVQELKKKFKFVGPVQVLHTMMVDPNGQIKRPKEKELAIAQGEILDVLQFTNRKMALCRNHIGKFGYVPRSLLLQMEGDIYDDIDHFVDVYDNDILP
ncbi:FYN-binding protein 1 [Gadus chalcogrammus]|uniref:FYN-binding protein 1 n=1 Tax=Gadus chalcogrammus TaxID=1042646 RepID=UPI0024C4C21B|nr:FYN-binding protein 1 [Gadus chalcogrammus]